MNDDIDIDDDTRRDLERDHDDHDAYEYWRLTIYEEQLCEQNLTTTPDSAVASLTQSWAHC